MKDKPDLVRAWLKKAASDLVAMRATAQAGSLDTACFHAQQAAEKYLKAYLLDRGQMIPHTHNLYKLIAECSMLDPAFNQLMDTADVLNPFAVEVRYDTEFWPTSLMFEDGEAAANRVAQFAVARLQSVAVKINTINVYAAWKAAWDRFNWEVDLRKFKDAAKYPGFFERIIHPKNLAEFEAAFRAELIPGGRPERAAEVMFWKTNGLFPHGITRALLNRLISGAWPDFVA